MRIVQLAIGTQGDVAPAMCVGKALRGRGADVCVLAGTEMAGEVERAGLEYASAGVDFKRIMTSGGGFEMAESGNGASFITLFRNMKRLFAEVGPTVLKQSYEACRGADAVMTGYMSDVFGVSIAQKLGIPHISAMPQPLPIATRAGQATPNAPFKGRDSWINYAFHKAAIEPFPWRLMGAPTNDLRRDVLGLPRQRRSAYQRRLERSLILQGISPHVVPPPADRPANIHTTGYWFPQAEAGWTPSAQLVEFLEDGEPAIFMGFGSMTARDPQQITSLLTRAAAAAGTRAVIQAGWAGLGAGELPSGCLAIGAVPHEWLFPRVSAVVHHGGCGTTAAALRAGRPAVIVPLMGDQPFWGERVHALGAGPKAIPWTKLTPESLAEAIRRTLTDDEMRRTAAELGGKIRTEDGVRVATDLIAEHLGLGAAGAEAPRGAAAARTGTQPR